MASKLNKIKKDTEALKEVITRRRPRIKFKGAIASPATCLNMAMTGNPNRCFLPGKYYLFVGDSGTGKTWFALSAAAELTRDPQFDNWDIYFDNGEDGALMDMRHYFGKKITTRLQAPRYDKEGTPLHSETVQELYYNIETAIEKSKASGRPFLYIQDSYDVLGDEQENEEFNERRKAHAKGTKAKGTYGMNKAKTSSKDMRRMLRGLRATGSILIIIAQAKQKIGAMMFEEQKTYSGGASLKFYATIEMWTSVAKKLKKKINDKDHVIGAVTRVTLKKNRTGGRPHRVEVPFYFSTGIDDVGGCIDYLLEQKHWTKSGGKINAPEFTKKSLSAEALIKLIEDNDWEDDLKQLVKETWNHVEETLTVRRKNRYQ